MAMTMWSTVTALLAVGASALPPAQHLPRQDGAAQTNQSASSLIDASIQALGGREALEGLQGVTYESAEGFRERTLSQNYHLFETDRHVVSSGSQNVSFSFNDDSFSQRIDRTIVPSDYWIFVRPEIAPRSFSLVAQSGEDGFVCLVKSSNIVLLPEEQTTGYMDSAMTEYLLSEAFKLSPKLLLEVEAHELESTILTFRELDYPAVYDTETGLTIAFDPKNSLPFLVRSFEDHLHYGRTAKDLQLYEYTEVDGIMFPTQQKILYGEDSILEETIVSSVHVNVAFEPGFFDGLGPDETETVPNPPESIPGIGFAQLGEWWSNIMWIGPYSGTLGNASASLPADDLPGLHRLEFLDATFMAQVILEFEDSVIVFEAPPQQSELVIQWVEENINKPISHLWVSHHHHDHSLAVASYVEIGASIIVSEVATSYWEQIPGISLITFNEEEPFIYSDANMQARFLFRPDTPHAIDWSYAVITSVCPDANSSMIAFTADAVSEGTVLDSVVSGSFLLQALGDRLSKDALLVPAHGDPRPFSEIYELLGSPYPDYDSTSFVTGGDICL